MSHETDQWTSGGIEATLGLNDIDHELSPASGDQAVVTPRRRSSTAELFSSSASLVAFLVVLIIYGFWLGDRFVSAPARMLDLAQSTPGLVLSLAVVTCLAAHQFDLSVSANATLSVFLTIGLYVRSGYPIAMTITIALVVGALIGLANGLIVTKIKMNAFIATLGTSGIIQGITAVYSSGQVISPGVAPEERLPSWFSGVGSFSDFQNKVPLAVGWLLVAALIGAAVLSFEQRFTSLRRNLRLGIEGGFVLVMVALVAWSGVVRQIDTTITILFVLAFVVWIMLKYTGFGRSLYAVGGNPVAATFSGINTPRVTLLAFVVSGLISAFAGVLIAARQGTAVPGVSDVYLLPAYAAAFLSTVLISRGRIHVWGTVVGGALLVYVSAGLVLGGIPFTWTQVINGSVLVGAVALSTFVRKR